MIPIPEELAKRVLEALEIGEITARAGGHICDALDRGGDLSSIDLIGIGIHHDADRIASVRAELAALLAPKEAI